MKSLKPYAGALITLGPMLELERQEYYRLLAKERDPMLAAELRGAVATVNRFLAFTDEARKNLAKEAAESEEVSGGKPAPPAPEAGGQTNATRSGYRSYNKRTAA